MSPSGESRQDRLRPFGERVARIREVSGLSRRRFAERFDIEQSTVFRWEAGRVPAQFEHVEELHKIAAEHGILAEVFPVLDFETMFFASDLWREDSAEDHIYLRAVLHNQPGIAARVLAVIAEHGGRVLRLAGFQDGDADGRSIFRVIFTLPAERPVSEIDEALNTLDGVLTTEYPASTQVDRQSHEA